MIVGYKKVSGGLTKGGLEGTLREEEEEEEEQSLKQALRQDIKHPFMPYSPFPSQHEFQSGYSTFMPLLSMQDKIYKAIEEDEYFIGFFCDFAKAFYAVNYAILLKNTLIFTGSVVSYVVSRYVYSA